MLTIRSAQHDVEASVSTDETMEYEQAANRTGAKILFFFWTL